MSTQESAPQASSSFTLCWRLLGIRFSIAPSFWIVSALMGYLVMQSGQIRGGFWVNLALWVLCTLVSVLIHELGHVFMGRFFGQPGNITLAGMGGQAAGKYEALTPRQRICIAAAGPCAGFLFLGLQILVDSTAWNWVASALPWDLTVQWSLLPKLGVFWRLDRIFQNVMLFLLLMNLFWNLLNLLPIYPMDGGMILRELCTIVAPSEGLKFAFGFSFILSSMVVAYCLIKIAMQREWLKLSAFESLPSIIDPYFGLLMFGMLAYQNFMLLRQVTTAQRTAHYQALYDD